MGARSKEDAPQYIYIYTNNKATNDNVCRLVALSCSPNVYISLIFILIKEKVLLSWIVGPDILDCLIQFPFILQFL